MDLSIYKNAWAIYKANFAKLFSFSLSYVVISVLAYVALVLFSAYDFSLVGILIISFGLAPLFYSYQVALLKASSGLELEYSDFYANYKTFYTKRSTGIYSILSSALISILMCIIGIFLACVLHDMIFPNVMEEAINMIEISDDISYYNEVINTCLNLEGFIPMLIVFLGFGHAFFFVSMKKKIMLPFFSLISPVPTMLNKMVNKTVYNNNKKEFSKYTSFGNLMFFIAFVVGFIGFGLIAYIFIDYITYIEYVFVIAFFGGMLLSSVLLAPTMITYCFIADSLHHVYLQEVVKELVKLNKTLKVDDDPDSENRYKEIDDVINLLINDLKENNDDTSHKEK